MKTVWIVGKNLDNNGKWEFQGVFDDIDKAMSACHTINDFIGPTTLNKEIPQESSYWPGAFYPIRE